MAAWIERSTGQRVRAYGGEWQAASSGAAGMGRPERDCERERGGGSIWVGSGSAWEGRRKATAWEENGGRGAMGVVRVWTCIPVRWISGSWMVRMDSMGRSVRIDGSTQPMNTRSLDGGQLDGWDILWWRDPWVAWFCLLIGGKQVPKDWELVGSILKNSNKIHEK
jgi:hypothetical protein